MFLEWLRAYLSSFESCYTLFVLSAVDGVYLQVVQNVSVASGCFKRSKLDITVAKMSPLSIPGYGYYSRIDKQPNLHSPKLEARSCLFLTSLVGLKRTA